MAQNTHNELSLHSLRPKAEGRKQKIKVPSQIRLSDTVSFVVKLEKLIDKIFVLIRIYLRVYRPYRHFEFAS